LTLKPKLTQLIFREPENDFKECLLGSDEEEPVVEPIVYNNPDYGFHVFSLEFKILD